MSVEYLVLGHFKREERDEYDMRTMAWLTPAAFDSSPTVSKQEVDEKLDEWEMLGVRVRKEARVGYSVRDQQARGVARLARDVQSEGSRIPGFRGFRTY